MAVRIPTPDEIRALLEEKKRKASLTQQQIDKSAEEAAKLDVAVHKKDEELRAKSAEIEKLMVEVAKLKDRTKVSGAMMRGKFDELIKKHACEPADELLRMCMEQVPMLNPDGSLMLNRDGSPMMRYALGPDLRANVLLKLMEFRMPKLRSTETQGQMDMTMRVVVVRFGDKPEATEAKAIDV